MVHDPPYLPLSPLFCPSSLPCATVSFPHVPPPMLSYHVPRLFSPCTPSLTMTVIFPWSMPPLPPIFVPMVPPSLFPMTPPSLFPCAPSLFCPPTLSPDPAPFPVSSLVAHASVSFPSCTLLPVVPRLFSHVLPPLFSHGLPRALFLPVSKYPRLFFPCAPVPLFPMCPLFFPVHPFFFPFPHLFSHEPPSLLPCAPVYFPCIPVSFPHVPPSLFFPHVPPPSPPSFYPIRTLALRFHSPSLFPSPCSPPVPASRFSFPQFRHSRPHCPFPLLAPCLPPRPLFPMYPPSLFPCAPVSFPMYPPSSFPARLSPHVPPSLHLPSRPQCPPPFHHDHLSFPIVTAPSLFPMCDPVSFPLYPPDSFPIGPLVFQCRLPYSHALPLPLFSHVYPPRTLHFSPPLPTPSLFPPFPPIAFPMCPRLFSPCPPVSFPMCPRLFSHVPPPSLFPMYPPVPPVLLSPCTPLSSFPQFRCFTQSRAFYPSHLRSISPHVLFSTMYPPVSFPMSPRLFFPIFPRLSDPVYDSHEWPPVLYPT
ncbi:hypothetical protein FKM82_020861 [Ascaphus truei]